MSLYLVLAVLSFVAARPMDPIVRGAPPGGVVGKSLSFPLGFHSSSLLVDGAGAAGVDLPIEDGYFCLEVLELPLKVLHECL